MKSALFNASISLTDIKSTLNMFSNFSIAGNETEDRLNKNVIIWFSIKRNYNVIKICLFPLQLPITQGYEHKGYTLVSRYRNSTGVVLINLIFMTPFIH